MREVARVVFVLLSAEVFAGPRYGLHISRLGRLPYLIGSHVLGLALCQQRPLSCSLLASILPILPVTNSSRLLMM